MAWIRRSCCCDRNESVKKTRKTKIALGKCGCRKQNALLFYCCRIDVLLLHQEDSVSNNRNLLLWLHFLSTFGRTSAIAISITASTTPYLHRLPRRILVKSLNYLGGHYFTRGRLINRCLNACCASELRVVADRIPHKDAHGLAFCRSSAEFTKAVSQF